MNKISIALCAYNGERFLPEQLESFSRQTRPPDELVVCDDCSTDNSTTIVEEFARRAAFPVRLYRNEKNLRSTKNFEKAIGLCTGDLIFLSDQDDVWMPEKLARVEAEFDKNPRVGMVFSDAEIVDENLGATGDFLWNYTFAEEPRRLARSGKFFEVLMSQNVVTGATMAIRADFRKTFAPIPENIPNLIHDGWISLVIAAASEVVFLEEPLIKYRQHAAQQLGIDYGKRDSEDFSQRRCRYTASIEFISNEIKRLNQIREIFACYPQFAANRGTVDFESLIEEKTAKAAHYQVRRDLPVARRKRLLPIVEEVSSGRYRRFSKGWRSAAKDLFEKW